MTKAAILIDGGFFLKRLPTVRKDIDCDDPSSVDKALGQLVWNHLENLQGQHGGHTPFALLYRCFYYDANPYMKRGHLPISKRSIDYAKTSEAIFRKQLFQLLRKRPSFAVRLGTVARERAWVMSEQAQKALIDGSKKVQDLSDADFSPGFRQKAVDMRLGLDIASLTLKKQVDTIILVAGDSDFVPAAKLSRREGVRVILDPLWQSVKPELFEHIDGLRSGFTKPERRINNEEDEA